MDTVSTNYTQEIGVEVSVNTTSLLDELEEQGVWVLAQQQPPGAAVSRLSDKSVLSTSNEKLDLRFVTPGESVNSA
ncbi:unnamed protein product [Peronospora belbahrii]|nr:unnamed protein product [Peronospora belbahrii]